MTFIDEKEVPHMNIIVVAPAPQRGVSFFYIIESNIKYRYEGSILKGDGVEKIESALSCFFCSLHATVMTLPLSPLA